MIVNAKYIIGGQTTLRVNSAVTSWPVLPLQSKADPACLHSIQLRFYYEQLDTILQLSEDRTVPPIGVG